MYFWSGKMNGTLVLWFLATLIFCEGTARKNEPRKLQNYAVRAFLCNQNNEGIDRVAPLELNENTIRVCLEPERNTELQDVSILKINFFRFHKAAVNDEPAVSQRAIDAGSSEPGTIYDCPGGKDKPCFFITSLRDNFFNSDGVVDGTGSVALQRNSRRHLRGDSDRDLQNLAGLVNVNLSFDVEDGFDTNRVKRARQNFQDHWNDQPAHIQGLYITGVLILTLLCCCLCAGLILWRYCCADVQGQWIRRQREGDEIHVMPPVGMDGKSLDDDDDVSQTRSTEDVVHENSDYEEEPDSYMQSEDELSVRSETSEQEQYLQIEAEKPSPRSSRYQ